MAYKDAFTSYLKGEKAIASLKANISNREADLKRIKRNAEQKGNILNAASTESFLEAMANIEDFKSQLEKLEDRHSLDESLIREVLETTGGLPVVIKSANQNGQVYVSFYIDNGTIKTNEGLHDAP